MKTYAAIKTEIARLEKRAEAMRKTEINGVIARMKEAIASYGLTAADLGFGRAAAGATPKPRTKAGKAAPSTAGVPRYRDPKTGATWTGRGRPPAWLPATGKRDRFLIDPQVAPAEPVPEGARKVRAAAKTSVKAKRASAPKEPGRAGKKSPARVKTAAAPAEPAVE